MRNKGYLDIHFNNSFDSLIQNGNITKLDRYKDCSFNKVEDYKNCFYFNDYNLFFKEDNGTIYNELIGSKIAKYLNINAVNYDLVCINSFGKKINGVVSKDFRIEGYNLIKLSDINCDDDVISLDSVYYDLDKYFSSYDNKDKIIDNIMNNLIIELSCDYLIGNIDNGKYNKELLVSSNDGMLTPYFDFGMIFNFKGTSFKFDSNSSCYLYDNINDLINSKYGNYFINMYEKLNPFVLEELIKEVEKDIEYSLPDNYKNIIFLSYSRHYEVIGELINKRKHVI